MNKRLKNDTKAQIWGKYKQLELWLQMYVTSLLEQDLRQFQAAWYLLDRAYRSVQQQCHFEWDVAPIRKVHTLGTEITVIFSRTQLLLNVSEYR